MRSYCSLYIDAGYLMAACSTRRTGTSLRSATAMDVPALLGELTAQVEAESGLPLLRIHWYDAGTRGGGPDPAQKQIAMLPRVKLRLGRVGYNGEQKGVDLKLALDLIAQARNRVAEIAYLVSGDDDLSEAVEEAQALGVQVIGLAVPGEDGAAIAVATNLQMTVDRTQLIDAELIDRHVKQSAAAVMATIASTPAVVEPAPAPPKPATPANGRPTPRAMPGLRPTPPPAPAPDPRTVPAYVTTTGRGGHFPGTTIDADEAQAAVEAVVNNVVMAWWRGATPDSRALLVGARPSIPPEVDRTLLKDLSDKLDLYDIPQEWRFALREAFWVKVDRS